MSETAFHLIATVAVLGWIFGAVVAFAAWVDLMADDDRGALVALGFLLLWVGIPIGLAVSA